MSALEGMQLSGRYRLDAQVGTGGMSTVYRAFDSTLERRVAIKLMHRDIAADSDQLERFGADLERARAVDAAHHEPGADRVRTPAVEFVPADGGTAHGAYGPVPYAAWRAAALAAGAVPADGPAPGVEDALRRFGSLAVPEVAAACDLPGPRASAELWRLALDWRARPQRVLGGELWAAAG